MPLIGLEMMWGLQCAIIVIYLQSKGYEEYNLLIDLEMMWGLQCAQIVIYLQYKGYEEYY